MRSTLKNVFLFATLCHVKIPSTEAFKRKSYDFIIVGGGSAGSVLANRLSENRDWNILLLEAGNEPLPISDIPLMAPRLLSSEMNWGYTYEKQDNIGHGIVNGRIDCTKGKALGGGSSSNFMLHSRGHRRDFDNWTSSTNTDWSYQKVLPYFIKSETSKIPNQDQGFHGLKGPIHVEEVTSFRTRSAKAFVASFQELGYRYTDYNGRNQSGVAFVQTDTKNGSRSSACRAYLDPVRNRPNLEIATAALVTRITIKNEDTVDGVEVTKNNTKHLLKATKEVIVAAGSLNTPQVMILSGLGPKEHLKELGIPLVKDLPVGKKLYDHLTFLGLIFVADYPITTNLTEAYGQASEREYEASRTGPYTSTGLVESLAFVKTTDDTDTTYPDVQLSLYSATLPKGAFRVKPEVWEEFVKPLQDKYAFTVLPILYHPKSCGYLRLNSTDPKDPPKMFGNHLADKRDVKSLIRAIRIMQEAVKQPSFKKYGVRLWNKPIPGCERLNFNSDSYWECALSYLATTIHHPTTTCKMGPRSDPEAVVNYDLRVRGIKKLRVADSSIIPAPQSTHTNVATIMLGEKAADIVKEFHNKRNH